MPAMNVRKDDWVSRVSYPDIRRDLGFNDTFRNVSPCTSYRVVAVDEAREAITIEVFPDVSSERPGLPQPAGRYSPQMAAEETFWAGNFLKVVTESALKPTPFDELAEAFADRHEDIALELAKETAKRIVGGDFSLDDLRGDFDPASLWRNGREERMALAEALDRKYRGNYSHYRDAFWALDHFVRIQAERGSLEYPFDLSKVIEFSEWDFKCPECGGAVASGGPTSSGSSGHAEGLGQVRGPGKYGKKCEIGHSFFIYETGARERLQRTLCSP